MPGGERNHDRLPDEGGRLLSRRYAAPPLCRRRVHDPPLENVGDTVFVGDEASVHAALIRAKREFGRALFPIHRVYAIELVWDRPFFRRQDRNLDTVWSRV